MRIVDAADKVQERSAHIFNDGESMYQMVDAEVDADAAMRMLLVGHVPMEEADDAVIFLQNLGGGVLKMLTEKPRTIDSVMATIMIALTQAFAVGSAQRDE
jgi:hypothetical protein